MQVWSQVRGKCCSPVWRGMIKGRLRWPSWLDPWLRCLHTIMAKLVANVSLPFLFNLFLIIISAMIYWFSWCIDLKCKSICISLKICILNWEMFIMLKITRNQLYTYLLKLILKWNQMKDFFFTRNFVFYAASPDDDYCEFGPELCGQQQYQHPSASWPVWYPYQWR